jgi:hypothetical protein
MDQLEVELHFADKLYMPISLQDPHIQNSVEVLKRPNSGLGQAMNRRVEALSSTRFLPDIPTGLRSPLFSELQESP